MHARPPFHRAWLIGGSACPRRFQRESWSESGNRKSFPLTGHRLNPRVRSQPGRFKERNAHTPERVDSGRDREGASRLRGRRSGGPTGA